MPFWRWFSFSCLVGYVNPLEAILFFQVQKWTFFFFGGWVWRLEVHFHVEFFFAIDDFFTFSHGQSLFEELPIGSPPTILSTGVSVVHHELKKAFPPREVTLFTVPQWDHAIWPSLETDLKLQRERSEEKHEEMNTATSRENGGGGNFNKDTSKNTGVPDTWAIIVASRRWGPL